jgi:hypothetical protein
LSDQTDDAGADFADCLDALAGIHSAEAIVHRNEAKRLEDLARKGGAYTDPHATAIFQFCMRGCRTAEAKAAATTLAAEACIAGAEALRSMPRGARP